jgi:hypothetical protein
VVETADTLHYQVSHAQQSTLQESRCVAVKLTEMKSLSSEKKITDQDADAAKR